MLRPAKLGPRRWYSNGDHPLDYQRALFLEPTRGETCGQVTTVTPAYQREHDWEGQRVRRYRTPFAEGVVCPTCTNEWDAHGWVDHVDHKGNSIEIDYMVCPGTPINHIDTYIEAVLEARG